MMTCAHGCEAPCGECIAAHATRSVPNALDEYQRLASRTMNLRGRDAVLCAALGLAGEAGECADLVKKEHFHKHDVTKEIMQKELGDVLWYLAMLGQAYGLSLSEIADANIEKLRRRYPDGFSEERSRNRTENLDPKHIERLLNPTCAVCQSQEGTIFVTLEGQTYCETCWAAKTGHKPVVSLL